MSHEIKKEVNTKVNAYYIKNVDMRYSFKTLETMATEMGVKLENGDVLVADNEPGTKRKVFKKTKSGAIIIYAMLFKDIFTELHKKSVANNALELLDYTK